jgi:hypothetical protein
VGLAASFVFCAIKRAIRFLPIAPCERNSAENAVADRNAFAGRFEKFCSSAPFGGAGNRPRVFDRGRQRRFAANVFARL